MQVSVIAEKLNIYTLQSVAISQGNFIVPTLDGQLLKVTPQGTSSILVDLLKAELGVPFGIADHGDDVIVTVSAYEPQHYLVRVKPDGTYAKIADLSNLSGLYGAPFGVTVYQDEYWVTHSQDVIGDKSQLLRVSTNGTITAIADLTQFGSPFGIVVRHRDFIVAQSFGHLVQVSPMGKVSSIVNLKELGFGLPFDVAVWGDRLVVTTNQGQVVQVTTDGKPSLIIDLTQQKLGIPSGVVVNEDDLIVTTNGGFVLKIAIKDANTLPSDRPDPLLRVPEQRYSQGRRNEDGRGRLKC